MRERSKKRVVPDFLVVGAAKSGTTALFRQLSSHPSIYIPPIKECRFFSAMPRNFKGGLSAKFANRGTREWGEYQGLFDGFRHQTCGDLSNDYFFYYERSIANITKYLGSDVPIVIVLRNPVDRIYSQYLHAVRLGAEWEDFETALFAITDRERQNYVWSMLYLKVGMSADATEAYKSAFRNVRVYLFEEIFSQEAMFSLQRFIGVPPIALRPVESINSNPDYLPRSRTLNVVLAGSRDLGTRMARRGALPGWVKIAVKKGLKNIETKNRGAKARLSADFRRELVATFEDDIARLERVIGRDLRSWRR